MDKCQCSYTVIHTINGIKFIAHENAYAELERFRENGEEGFIILESPNGEQNFLRLRFSAVIGYFLSIPEDRASWDEFAESISDDDEFDDAEPWK